MTLRHEMKHEISPADLYAIRMRLDAVAERDRHAENGRYFIRSLYFDNLYDKALREKLDGVNIREKFRIRLYNRDPSMIRLEKKYKHGGLGCKFSAVLTPEQAQAIADGDIGWMARERDPLLAEFYAKMEAEGLRAKTIVDYTREPFVYAPGNVRVTLDYDIRTGLGSTDLLHFDAPTVPVSGSPIILEVKWDEYLPDIIRGAVQLEGRRAAAFSKYAACRMYD